MNPQIVIGPLVDRGGFPLEIGCFEGNKAETTTIVPIVKQFQGRHGLAEMVVAADVGMLSTSKLTALDEAGLSSSSALDRSKPLGTLIITSTGTATRSPTGS